MKVNFNCRKSRLLFLCILITALTANLLIINHSAAQTRIAPRTIERFYDPIEIRAAIFTKLHGAEIDRLGLFSYQGNTLDLIPFQFDEWTPGEELILNLGKNNNADKANFELDPQDMLVFMARDLGDKITTESWKEIAPKGVEVEVVDPLTQKKGWVYLLYLSEKVPPVKKIYSAKMETESQEFSSHGTTYNVYGTTRKIRKKMYRTFTNRFISINPEAGGSGINFIDRAKIRASLTLVFGMIHIDIDEDNFIGEIDKYSTGPVRSSGRQWMSLVLPMNLKSPKVYGDMYIYDTMIFIPAQVNFPFNPGYVVTNFQLNIGYDLHDPQGRGMKYFSDRNPQGFTIDGKMDNHELNDFDEEPDKWRCVVGPQGWMVHRSLWDEDYKQQANIKMKYIDDISSSSPPDYFPGNLGYYYTESEIEYLEPRKYFFQLEWYWPYRLYTPSGPNMKTVDEICNIRDHPLLIKVGKIEAVNSGAFLTPMTP